MSWYGAAVSGARYCNLMSDVRKNQISSEEDKQYSNYVQCSEVWALIDISICTVSTCIRLSPSAGKAAGNPLVYEGGVGLNSAHWTGTATHTPIGSNPRCLTKSSRGMAKVLLTATEGTDRALQAYRRADLAAPRRSHSTATRDRSRSSLQSEMPLQTQQMHLRSEM